MTKISETVTFFGSGPVAAKSLELLAQNFKIEAVFTKAKPAHHRGSFPVLDICEKYNFTVFTAGTKQELSEIFATKPVKSRLGVVIDYGVIISQDVIDYFPLGIVNSHFSLLPEWRGADPLTFSVLSGQKRTGVSLMLITAGLDEGDLLSQTPYDMPKGITTPQLTHDLIELSNQALSNILPLYVSGECSPAPQETATIAESKIPTYSRKLTKDDGIINWNKPAEQIEREIRAYAEWPKSRTTLANKDVIITSASVIDKNGRPGIVLVEDKRLIVCCDKNALSIESLKPAGKGIMTGEAFLAGYGKNL